MIAKGLGKPLLLSSLPLLAVSLLFFLVGIPLFLFAVFLIPPIFTMCFFRDPERSINEGIVSPADGKIVYLNPERNEVAIFMNIWDVHVNRSPWGGEVKEMNHKRGGHLPAFSREADKNERHILKIDTEYGTIKLWQIAGCFARRIVPYVDEEEDLKKGEKIGMIRFGSKVKLRFSRDVDFVVEEGERVKAGETRLGGWNE